MDVNFQLMFSICLLINALFQIEAKVTHEYETCFYVDSSMRSNAVYNAVYQGNYAIEEGCLNKNICNRTFNIAYMERLPGYYKASEVTALSLMLDRCCGSCNRINDTTRYQDISEIPHPSRSSIDFIYPVLALDKTTKLYGYHFLSYHDAPGAIYVTRKDYPITISTIIEVYPLVIIMFLMSMIAGFIAWILETWRNKEEFSRPFMSGWFDGFWWSFISMTTVGYGDKAPKSYAGRLFAVGWIILGLVVNGMIVGWISGEVFKAGKLPPPDMKGKNVGMIQNQDYEGYVVAKHGGIAVEIKEEEGQDIFITLIRKLRRGGIEGFIMDKFNLWGYQYYWLKENKTKYTDDINFFFNETLRTEKHITEPKLVYGVLVKRMEDYDYFNEYVRDNKVASERFAEQNWIREQNNINIMQTFNPGSFYVVKDEIMSVRGYYFRYTVIALSAMIFVIGAFGVFYEYQRQKKQ